MLNQTIFWADLLGGHSTCLRRLAFIGARHAGGPRWMPADEGGACLLTCLLAGNCCPQLTECQKLTHCPQLVDRAMAALHSQTCLCRRLSGGALSVLRFPSCGICFRQSANRRKTASKFCKNPINCGQHESTLQPVLKRLRSLRSGLIRSSAVGSGSQIQEPSYNVPWFAVRGDACFLRSEKSRPDHSVAVFD